MKRGRERFHFVQGNPSSERERRREVQLARSHTARVNREKRHSHTRGQATTQPEVRRALPDIGASASETKPSPVNRTERRDVEEERAFHSAFESLGLTRTSERSRSTTSSHTADESPDRKDGAEVIVAKPRTLSPVVGAPTTGAFALGSSLADNVRAADYCKTCRQHPAQESIRSHLAAQASMSFGRISSSTRTRR
jgi:hypothetical protein